MNHLVVFLFCILGTQFASGQPQLLLRSNSTDDGFQSLPGTDIANQTPVINEAGDVMILLNKKYLWARHQNQVRIEAPIEGPRFLRLYDISETGTALLEIVNDDFFSEGLVTLVEGHLQSAVPVEMDLLTIQFFGASYFGSNQSLTFLAEDAGRRQFLFHQQETHLKTLAKQSKSDKVSFLFTPSANQKGQTALKVRRGVDPFEVGAVDELRLYQTDGTFQVIADTTGPLEAFRNGVSLNDQGHVAFVAKARLGAWGVYLWKNESAILLATEGHGPLESIDFFTPQLNNRGEIAFRGMAPSQTPSLFLVTETELQIVITRGQEVETDLGVAQLGQHNWTDPLFSGNVAFNDRGDLVFAAGLHPRGDDQIEWGTGLFKINTDQVGTR